ncbi:DUF2254 domain-containing protein [Mycobacterium sp. SMC-4]|uniref:DUF2254 domain-containing protein n=1 Tax=Mycobacterium sp. SMC-4 TaxID=2857059 RepID=UPI003CFD8419
MARTLPALRFSTAAYRFRESLFFLPVLVVVLGAVLAEVTALIDGVLGPDRALPLTVQMNSNAATWLLSTVAGAMITTAGVVFSLTVVSLQLASSQFSPRVMRSFIRDRLSQSVIGLLVATFVFSVLVLRHIDADEHSNAPRISMTVAIALTLTTVVLIIAYLNRLAFGLQVGEVVRTITDEATEVLRHQTREVSGEVPADGQPAPSGRVLSVLAGSEGWVTQAPSRHILASVPPGTTVRLETRTGAYIHRGEVLMSLWPAPEDSEAVERRVLSTVEIAANRTMQHDVDFSIRQLVDIALRALSPAINDPTTATEVVLRLGSLLRDILITDQPPLEVQGPDGRVLLRPWNLSHNEYIEHAFDQIRQSVGGQLHVATAVMRVLNMLIEHVSDHGRDDAVPALRAQQRMLMENMESHAGSLGIHHDDLARLRAVYDDTDPAEHELQ